LLTEYNDDKSKGNKMKINLLLMTIFTSVIIYAGVKFSDGITGATQLNGEGCTCHSFPNNESVMVWVEGPNEIIVGHNAAYKIYLSGGPAIAGGFNVAVLNGLLESTDNTTNVDFGELTHSFPKDFVGETINWEFNYVAPTTPGVDIIYSVANSVNLDGDPDDEDQWNFGENFVINIVEDIVPVELTSFSASIVNAQVLLDWETATEINNHGFFVERSFQSVIWETLDFVEGNGNSNSPKYYTFKDDNIGLPGTYSYRLKQTDIDGTFDYSFVVEVDIAAPLNYELKQNYPNPFNPVTTISWQMNSSNLVILKVYDILGNEIELLLTEFKEAGYHSFNFDASEYGSGIYFYSLQAGSYNDVKKMNIIK
jgi:hypothetical protein